MHRSSLIALLAATAAVAACQEEQPQTDANLAEEPVRNLPVVPRPVPPLDRQALLAAVIDAGSATAAGVELPETVRSLDGRQFEVRIRFGCRGPVTQLKDEWLGWSFDPETRRIRVRAIPTISSDEPLVEKLGGEDFEAVEGFWIPRPWLIQSVCPSTAAVRADGGQTRTQPSEAGQQAGQRQSERERSPPESGEDEEASEPVPTAPRVGIAQFYTDQDPRTGRRDMRPYEASSKLPEGQAISSQGFNLVLSGRLRALPGRGVIQCSARGPDSPPECIVSAEFLRVWIEQPDTREVIAQWGGG